MALWGSEEFFGGIEAPHKPLPPVLYHSPFLGLWKLLWLRFDDLLGLTSHIGRRAHNGRWEGLEGGREVVVWDIALEIGVLGLLVFEDVAALVILHPIEKIPLFHPIPGTNDGLDGTFSCPEMSLDVDFFEGIHPLVEVKRWERLIPFVVWIARS